MKWFWVKDEWAPGFLDHKYIAGNLPKLGALGWADKVWHYFGEWILTIHIGVIMPRVISIPVHFILLAIIAGLIGFLFGVLWEWLMDCVFTKGGASKLDLIFDAAGCLCGIFTIILFYVVGGVV